MLDCMFLLPIQIRVIGIKGVILGDLEHLSQMMDAVAGSFGHRFLVVLSGHVVSWKVRVGILYVFASPTAGSCCGPKKLQAGQRPAAHYAGVTEILLFWSLLMFWLCRVRASHRESESERVSE